MRLGDVAELVSGVGFPVEHQGERAGQLPFVKVSDLRQSNTHVVNTAANYVSRQMAIRLHARVCPPGTVLFPKVGGALLTNRRAVLGAEAVFDNNVMGAVPVEVEPDWLYFWFRSLDLSRHANTQSLPSIRQSVIAELRIPVPSVEEQRKMSAELGLMLAVCRRGQERCHEQLERTRSLRGEVLDTAFDGLRRGHQALLGDTGALKDGDWILTADYAPSGVRLFQVGDVGRGTLLAKSSRYVPPARVGELKCTLLRTGDVLISRMADPIGRACAVPDLGYEAITAVDVTIFRPDPQVLDVEYAVQFMNSPSWLRAVASKASGATRARISRLNLELLQVPLPALEVQRRTAAEVRLLVAAIDSIEASIRAELAAIDALPAALLRRAFEDVAA